MLLTVLQQWNPFKCIPRYNNRGRSIVGTPLYLRHVVGENGRQHCSGLSSHMRSPQWAALLFRAIVVIYINGSQLNLKNNAYIL